MSLRIKIADISIILQGADFLKLLRPDEMRLIRPFLKRHQPSDNYKAKGFVFDLTTITHKVPGCRKVNPELIRGIKSCFPDNAKTNYARTCLRIFFDKYLPQLLDTNAVKRKKITRLFKKQDDYNKIILNKYAFAIFDSGLKRGYFVYSDYFVRYLRECKFITDTALCNLNFLRLLFRMILTFQKDAMMLHAASVARGSCGYVFIGRSNSGKSTTVEMLKKPFRTLSDETTIIRKIGNSYKLFFNPWWNIGNHNLIKSLRKPAQLKAIFFIKKSEKTSIRKLTYKESLTRLIYGDGPFQCFDFIDNKTGMRNFYLFVQSLLKAIPSFELNIKKNKNFRQEFCTIITGINDSLELLAKSQFK